MLKDSNFDLFRLSKAKDIVDISPNTIRKMFVEGLPSYRHGVAVFISKRELDHHIRNRTSVDKPRRVA